MGISNATETNFIKLWFMATAVANIADNATGTPQTNVACATHTADPADAGTMSTSESAYTNYARPSVLRSASGWAESGGVVSPLADINFTTSGGGTATAITHFSTGKTGGGATDIYLSGTVTPNITPTSGVPVLLGTSTTIGVD